MLGEVSKQAKVWNLHSAVELSIGQVGAIDKLCSQLIRKQRKQCCRHAQEELLTMFVSGNPCRQGLGPVERSEANRPYLCIFVISFLGDYNVIYPIENSVVLRVVPLLRLERIERLEILVRVWERYCS